MKGAAALALAAAVSTVGLNLSQLPPLVVVAYGFVLSWAVLIDIDRFVLPDLLMFTLIVIGLAGNLSFDLLASAPYMVGCALGFLSLRLVAMSYEAVRGQPGLGIGDAKLFAASGSLLGVESLAPILLIAAISGLLWVLIRSIYRREALREPMPFGPFIGLGTWVYACLPGLA